MGIEEGIMETIAEMAVGMVEEAAEATIAMVVVAEEAVAVMEAEEVVAATGAEEVAAAEEVMASKPCLTSPLQIAEEEAVVVRMCTWETSVRFAIC